MKKKAKVSQEIDSIDKKILLASYESLEVIVKKVIKKYAEESKVLSPSDFK